MVAYGFLYWGTFVFAIANGTLAAVANPLVATLFPTKRMHYLNILHASWPAGLVAGARSGGCSASSVGPLLTSRIETFTGAMFALLDYGVGKTFFWPTMLAVASDRFPQTGAIAISIMGGIGMMAVFQSQRGHGTRRTGFQVGDILHLKVERDD